MNVVPSTNPKVAGHVPVGVLPGQVDAAHVGAVAEDAGETWAPALLADLDQLDRVAVLRGAVSQPTTNPIAAPTPTASHGDRVGIAAVISGAGMNPPSSAHL
jgi:hypothetical protein